MRMKKGDFRFVLPIIKIFYNLIQFVTDEGVASLNNVLHNKGTIESFSKNGCHQIYQAI